MCAARSYVGKHIIVIVGMYLWADVAKTALEMTKPRRKTQTMMSATVGPATDRKALAPSAEEAQSADDPVASSDTCSALDAVHRPRRTPEPEYPIDDIAIESAERGLDGVCPSEHIVPFTRDGITRFKLVTAGQDGFYAKLGFQNGDILVGVNGYEMHDAEEALAVYKNLRECNVFEVTFERQGRVVRRTHRVRHEE